MVATQWGCLLLTHLRHARLTTLQRKKSQSVLLQSVARRLYKDRSLTMGRQKRRPTIVARRPITLARSPAPAAWYRYGPSDGEREFDPRFLRGE